PDGDVLRGGRIFRGKLDRFHPWRGEAQTPRAERHLDQRHARKFALRDEASLWIDRHPFAVAYAGAREPGDQHIGAVESDTAATLDRVDVQAGDGDAGHSPALASAFVSRC